MNHPLSFPKSERLSFRTMIDALFAKGETIYAYPLRMTFRLVNKADVPEELHGAHLQLMVNAPKKRFRHAVDRVRCRRLMREAWRLQRVPLRDKLAASCPDCMLHVGIVYASSKMAPFASIEAKTAKLLNTLDSKFFPQPSPAQEADATTAADAQKPADSQASPQAPLS
ncbi:MAG: hypothetical protein HDS66_02975 [Bacteroidales bacterium]|nr:hypothetical protein [Bacteroidales bacterium]